MITNESDISKIVTYALAYIGDRKGTSGDLFLDEIKRSIEEIEKNGAFKACTGTFALGVLEENGEKYPYLEALDLVLRSKDLQSVFAGADKMMVIVSTLGVSMERYIRRVGQLDMSHELILDATASAYLEVCTDLYEQGLSELAGKRSFRFAPGYGDLPLSLNYPLWAAIDAGKRIGVSITEGGLFLPQKSMLGIIGIGSNQVNKDCMSCLRKNSCSLRKENVTCWNS